MRQLFCRRVVSPLLSSTFASLFIFLATLFAALGGLAPSAGAQTAHFSYAYGGGWTGFNSPAGVAVDRNGNIFVADTGNQAVKEILAAGGYTTVKTLACCFDAPVGVAVDGNGNVFVINNGYNSYDRTVKEILAAGGYTTVVTLASGFIAPNGIAADGSGNVFVTDSQQNGVKEILAAGGYTTVNTLGSGLAVPEGVAVDGNGNVFVALANNEVKEILAEGGYTTINTLGSGFQDISGIAVDRSGNVFVNDNGHVAVKEILAEGGYTTVITVIGRLFNLAGVAVDGSGNVFVTVGVSNVVLKLETTAADFGTLAVGQKSGQIPLIFTFDSSGTVGSPIALTQGAAGLDFAVVSTGTCVDYTTSYNYSVGNTCTVDVTFTPKFAGVRNGAVVLKDSAGNTLATAYVHGIGSGPQVNFSPGTQSALGSGFANPAGVAVDGNGNVFVADAGHNAVKEIVGGVGTPLTLGSGFDYPLDVAGDGSGNVFVADANHNAVKEIVAAGGYTTVGTLGSGFTAPIGVAVDGNGNVFVADSGNNAVKEIVAAGGYTTVKTLGSGFATPTRVAVDGNGNVFVADSGNNAVKEIVAAGGYTTVTTLATGFSPRGVAVDASGNVIVTDYSNNAVKEIVAAGGYTTVTTLATGFSAPRGLTVDRNGNVFVADYGNNAVKELDFADPPSLTFTSTNVGSTSSDSPQTLTVTNVGNATLRFPIPSTGSNPDITANFTLDSSGATACPLVSASSSTTGSLAAGASCLLPISFEPTTAGTLNGSLVLTDNHLNASSPYATQTVSLSGTATHVAVAQSITFTLSPSTVTYGVSPIALVATASSGLSVTFTVVSGPGSVSGNMLTITGAGSIVIEADQAGNSSYTAAPHVQQTLIVNQATPTISWATPAPITYGTALSSTQLNATASVPGTLTYMPAAGTLLGAGSQALSVSFTPSDTTDYTTATGTVTLVVNKAATTITWSTPAPITYGTALSGSQLDATANVQGSFIYSPTLGAVLGVGSQTLNVTFTPTDTTDYNSASSSVTLQVNQAAPTVTFTGAPANAPYQSSFTVTATTNASTTAMITASGACSVAGNTVTMTSGTGTCSLTASWAADTNYTAASLSQSTTAATIAPTVHFTGAPGTVAYQSSFPVTATTNASTIAVITASGACSISGNTVTMTSGTGTCNLTANWAADANYSAASLSQTAAAAKATPLIVWATPANIGYSTPLGAAQLNATAVFNALSVTGTFVYTPPAGTLLPYGNRQALSVAFAPTDSADFNPASGTVYINVVDNVPPVITISANPSTLWPPNGKSVPVTVSGTITDSGSGVNPSTLACKVVDKYGLVQPPCSVGPLGTGGAYSFTVLLVSSRAGSDQNGRTYTISVTASDYAGNPASASTTIIVPHDQGN